MSVPRPMVGQITKTRVNSFGTNPSEAIVELEVTAMSNISQSTSKVTTGDVEATGTTVMTFTISDGFLDVTEIVSDDTTTIDLPVVGPITTTTNTKLIFDPSRREPIDEVCENQTWTSTYDLTTEVLLPAGGGVTSNTSSMSIINTVESINEAVTVEAGTFTTFKLKSEYDNSVDTFWVDINSGKTVSSESKDSSGTLLGTQELIE